MVFVYLSLRSKVQQLAAAARNLVRQCGGRVSEHSILQKVSAIGTEGKHWSNCERDLQRLILKKDHALDAEIETVQVRLYNPKTEEETLQPLSMIFPDKLAAALYTTSEPLFKKLFLGDRVDPAKYWTHCRQHAKWMEGHPAMEQTNSEKLIPMSLYGDEVQSFRNTEGGVVSVLAWCSDFSAGMASLSRYFTICVLPDHYTTGGTWTDIWKILAPRINRMCDNRVDHPWSSGGYHFTYSSTQGDLKWLLEKFGLHNFKKNNICSWCGVCKAHENPSMTIGDFREEAEHRQTRISHEQFFTNLGQSPTDYHPIFGISGCRLERFMHDVCHSQLLGTGKVCNGSVMVYLCEIGFFGGLRFGQYTNSMSQCLRVAYRQFNEWKSNMKLQVTQPRFTPSRLSRVQRNTYPCLSSKAAASKAITFWLCECAIENGRKASATELDKHVANCIWTYAKVLRSLDDTRHH